MSAPEMELRRVQQEAPTKPGWYYARAKKDNNPEYRKARPTRVVETSNGLGASYMYTTHYLEPLGMFNWFGPVPVCVESGR